MMQMFGEFDEWSIVIFDNVLLLAHDEGMLAESSGRS